MPTSSFLYRDEVYNPETNDRASAEVIVAKHRWANRNEEPCGLGNTPDVENAARGGV